MKLNQRLFKKQENDHIFNFKKLQTSINISSTTVSTNLGDTMNQGFYTTDGT